MTWPRRAGLAMAVLVAAGCSSGTGAAAPTAPTAVTGSVLAVGAVPAAVQAVEAARGGPQRYVEINATPDGVNVFVATDATNEVGYYFTGGRLEPAGAPEPQTSPPFELAGIDLALAAALVERTQQQLPGSTVVSVALVEVSGEGLRWALRSRSALGGLLNVLYTPAGDLVSVSPAT